MDSTANQSLEHESRRHKGHENDHDPTLSSASSSTSHLRASSLALSTSPTDAEGDRIYRFIIAFHLKSNGSTISNHDPIVISDVPCIVVKRFSDPGQTFKDIAKKITERTGWQIQETLVEEDRVFHSTWVIQFMCHAESDGRECVYVMGELRMSLVGEYTREEALEKLWVEIEKDDSVEGGDQGEGTGEVVGRSV
ncbi:hypothetical protein PMIN06_003586 [Paraphaeosphaeria minitans]|uniref:Uncharacterized protein n=1 Tax=Paraphaeosphaeria minitans TaxID=565426 RepID=A0A9P6KTJ3_9PLEO|nr:hypothetical protein PMIN01_01557 [Paraphaeosphaeria minitans]